MKKFINDVWTVQLPNKDIHITADVGEDEIKDFVKGRGLWGENALYLKNTETLSVFDSTAEASNYVNYVSNRWERSFDEILEEASSPAHFNSIVHYVNMYKDGLVSPEGYICIPVELPEDQVLEVTMALNPEYDTLTEEEKEQERQNTISVYNTIISVFNPPTTPL
jgi:hypothetical protein